MDDNAGLGELRRKIDEIDRQLLDILNDRAKVSLEIGKLKQEAGRDVCDLQREKAVIDAAIAASQGPLSPEDIHHIYMAVISASRRLQRPLRVAYLGPAATFTHQAARDKFGDAVEYHPCHTIPDVFVLTEKGETDFGVVPIENSTEGAVSHTLDSFIDSQLQACAEISLPITQNLLSKSPLCDIRVIYSHPQAIAQTRHWMSANMPAVDLVEVSSTAKAAKMAAQEPGTAAIGNEMAASVYGLHVVAPHIEDNPHNVTRFLVIGKTMATRSGHDATALFFSVKHQPGALYHALGVFARRDISLSRIESRPAQRKTWEYDFFVDIAGHPQDDTVQAALKELGEVCMYYKVIGAWPV
jgi:chorismate mutase/prephenate dehydratase